MPWQDVAEVIAPTIATALMGPAGGVVATIAAKFLFENGGDSPALATPKAVAEKIATLGSPEDLAKLKQAEAAVKQFESDNKFRFADLDARSIQDARTMRLSALGQGNSTADRLSWVVIASFGVVSVVTLFG